MPDEPSLQGAFEDICRDVKQFQGYVGKLTARIQDVERRERVEGLLQDLQKAFSDVEDAVPKAIASLEEQHKAQVARLREAQARVVALRQQLEEARKPKPAAAAAPAPAPDPAHGARLRQEVLDRFGEQAPAGATVPHGEVTDMPSAAWARQSAETPRPAPAPQRNQDDRKPAAPRRGDGVADMSSGAWDKDEPQ